ncbi:tetratricopeptide repeat protein [Micromonospora sp. FIMYZ51]|uniref:ATP-binding protein n=1 Tax=Micromonospora sp. FIMYZ51 TaxID=3051832 RepID=UPI00311EE1F8
MSDQRVRPDARPAIDRVSEASRSTLAIVRESADVRTVHDLAGLLRQLRRRHARQQGDTPLTYRQLAAKTGWSRGIIGEYFAGNVLPSTERFDILTGLLGATGVEQGALATARDRVEEGRRQPNPADGQEEAEVPVAQASAPAAGAARRSTVVPHQLPPALASFVGRTAQLAQLDVACGVDNGSAVPGAGGPGEPAATSVVLSGTAGVGKTTLAVYWAHRVAERYPDGQLYVNLRGFDPAGPMTTPAEAVRGFLEALDVPPERIPAHLPAQVGLYRSLLAGRRMLVVLDNAHDADQVRPLLPGSPGCLALVTSRNRLAGLVAAEGARPITVDLLTVEEARQMLARRLGADRLTVEPRAVDEMIERCARLPLALAVVAARGLAHPGFPLATLAAELRQTRRLRDAFDGGDVGTDVQAVFSWSYQSLTPPAARLFRLLGCHCGPEIGIPAAASLAGLPRDQVHRLLAELANAHLVTEHAPGRFGTHDLLRGYAAELIESTETPGTHRAAIQRGLDHYLHSAHSAALRLQPSWDPIPLAAAPPGVVPEAISDHRHALAWFTAEHRVLLAAVAHAARIGFEGHAWRLARTLVDFLQRRGHWFDLVDAQQTALAAARRANDPSGQASAHRDLARVLARTGERERAESHYRAALKLFGELDDCTGQARTHRAFGAMLDRLGRHTEVLYHAQRAADLYRAVGHLSGEASAQNGIGWAYAQLGQYGPALEHCRRALVLLRRTDDRHGEANTWDSLGFIYDRLGRHRRAVRCYHRALRLFVQIGDRYDEAESLIRLGASRRSSGDRAGAARTWQRALRILDDLGHPDAECVREQLVRTRGGRQERATSRRQARWLSVRRRKMVPRDRLSHRQGSCSRTPDRPH